MSVEHAAAVGFSRRQRDAIARLRLPRARVTRESLLTAMDALAPLTQICAPPGTGRTTLLADWALRRLDRGDIVLWISGAPELNTVEAFSARLADLVWGRDEASAAERSPTAGEGPPTTREGPPTAGEGPPTAGEGPPLGEEERAAARAHTPPAGEDPLEAVCRAHPGSAVLLVVDDYEHVAAGELRRWVGERCVRHPNLHIAAATGEVRRHEAVDAHLPRTLLTGSRLMLAEEEVRAFARSWGHRVREDEVPDLHRASGGWLQLLRLVLEGREAGGAEARVRGFRALLQESPHSAALLGAASAVAVLGTATEGLLDHVDRSLPGLWATLGVTGLQPTAETLAVAGIVRPREEDGASERCLVLPEALRVPLAQEFTAAHPAAVRALHALAARHFAEGGRPEDLARVAVHSRRAEDWPRLSALAARDGWYLGARHPETALETFGSVPPEVLERNPVLAVTSALVHGLAAARREPEHRSFGTQRAFGEMGGELTRRALGTADPDERVFLATAVINGLRLSGEVRAALHVSEELRLSTLHRRDAVAPLGRAMYYLQSGFAELSGGDLDRAVRRWTRAYEEATSVQSHFTAVSAAAHTALVHSYELRRESAADWLARAQALIEEQPWTAALVRPVLALAHANLALDGFDRAEAQRRLEEAGPLSGVAEVWPLALHVRAGLALAFGHPAVVLDDLEYAVELREARAGRAGLDVFARALVTRARCDLLMAQGELNRAHALMAEALGHDPAALRDAACSELVRTLCVAYARLSRMRGHPEEARQVVSMSLARSLTRRQTIELHLIDAAAALDLGEPEAAARSAARALSLAERAGVRTVLLLLDLRTRLTLLDLVRRDRRVELPGLQPSLFTHPGVYPRTAEFVDLTEREASVLRALAAGLSVAEIAQAQVLSVNTVKKQTVSLYRRLGVDGRAEALRRAYELRLLS
jgi:LuxR family maltose regulon positive regulatory protein